MHLLPPPDAYTNHRFPLRQKLPQDTSSLSQRLQHSLAEISDDGARSPGTTPKQTGAALRIGPRKDCREQASPYVSLALQFEHYQQKDTSRHSLFMVCVTGEHEPLTWERDKTEHILNALSYRI